MRFIRIAIIAIAASIISDTSFARKASWYGDKFHGRKTASGEIYDKNKMTCAHKTLPFGTIIVVENIHNGLTAKCRVNDRGPYVKGRVIDVSKAVAKKLKIINRGVAKVRLTVLGRRK